MSSRARLKIILLFTLSLVSVRSWAETCEPMQFSSPSGLTALIQENCSLLVGDSRSVETRGYLFTSDAELRIILGVYSTYPSVYLQAAHSFYLFPRKFTAPKVISNENDLLVVQTPSGQKATFSHETRELVSLTGFELTVTPSLSVSRETQGGVTLKPKRGALLLDTGWAPFPFGTLTDPNREFQLVEWTDGFDRTCRSIYFEVFSPVVANETHVFRFATDAQLDDYLSEACPELGWTDSPQP